MADKIRFGILSTARIGRALIPAINATPNAEVVAVASRDADRAQAFAQQHGVPRAYGRYEDLLAADDIDAIYNPLPNSEHAPWSLRAAEHGKHVLCEKPMARNADEAQHMADAFGARGLLLAEAFMVRYHPQTQRVLALLAEGAVGTVRAIRGWFTFNISAEDDVRLSRPLAGGALMDVGCYPVAMMRLLTGEEPVAAHADAILGAASDVDETLAGVLRFPSGVLGHFDCSLRASKAHGYDIIGTHGRLRADVGFGIPHDHSPLLDVWGADGTHHQETIPAANSYQLMAEDFARAILEGRMVRYGDPADAVAQARALDMLLTAATGRTY